jgi:hypothetical protein
MARPRWATVLCCAGAAAAGRRREPQGASPLPLLFMSVEDDALLPWGLQYEAATPVANLTAPGMRLPPGGAREIFDPNPRRPTAGYELWAAAAAPAPRRRGELHAAGAAEAGGGAAVTFSTTVDFATLSAPVVVGTLPLGCKLKTVGRSDDGARYLLLAFCHGAGGRASKGDGTATHSEGIRTFTTTAPHVAGSLRPADPGAGRPGAFAFVDHDDQQLLWDPGGGRQGGRWVAFQIMFQDWRTPGYAPTNATAFGHNQTRTLKYCDNSGCDQRRVPSFRTADADGRGWSNSSGCAGGAEGPHSDQTVVCPRGYDPLGLLLPDPVLDPPELEFYKLTPFRLGGGSPRLAAHAMLYAPRPAALGRRCGLMFTSPRLASPRLASPRLASPRLASPRLASP